MRILIVIGMLFSGLASASTPSPWEVLGLPDDAPFEDVKKRHHELVRKLHESVDPSPDAAKRLSAVNAAVTEIQNVRNRAIQGNRDAERQELMQALSAYPLSLNALFNFGVDELELLLKRINELESAFRSKDFPRVNALHKHLKVTGFDADRFIAIAFLRVHQSASRLEPTEAEYLADLIHKNRGIGSTLLRGYMIGQSQLVKHEPGLLEYVTYRDLMPLFAEIFVLKKEETPDLEFRKIAVEVLKSAMKRPSEMRKHAFRYVLHDWSIVQDQLLAALSSALGDHPNDPDIQFMYNQAMSLVNKIEFNNFLMPLISWSQKRDVELDQIRARMTKTTMPTLSDLEILSDFLTDKDFADFFTVFVGSRTAEQIERLRLVFKQARQKPNLTVKRQKDFSFLWSLLPDKMGACNRILVGDQLELPFPPIDNGQLQLPF